MKKYQSGHVVGDEHETLIIDGTNKSDSINTGGGAQYVIADNGSDYIFSGGGPDVVEGQNGNDTILGGGGPDKLFGNNGSDLIIGGPGPDELNGGNGSDTLEGGAAFDILTGGQGMDVFVFDAHSTEDEGHGELISVRDYSEDNDHWKMDTITDFKSGVDKIDFTKLEAVKTFSFEPAEYSVWVEQDGVNAIVRVDTNGDLSGGHIAEINILLLGIDANSLSVKDFLLA